METFIYKARNPVNGKKIKGEIRSESEANVRELIINKKLEPIMISKKTALNADLGDLALFKPRIKLQDTTFFCKQFASMVQAGISVGRGLNICADQCSNRNLKEHLMHVHHQVSEGKTLSEAIKEEHIFPPILESLIECGEASGNLDKVLKRSVEHFDNALGVRKKIMKALSYPLIVLVVVVIVVIILMIKVIPSFMGLLAETGAETPLATKIVIAVSDFMVQSWPVLLGIFIALLIIILNITRIPVCKRWLDRVALKLPIVGDLNKKSISSTFSSTMSMLVESGIPMLHAMEITRTVINNSVADEELELAINGLREGQSLYDSLSGSEIYPPIMFSMISIGEESGSLDDMLAKISIYFKEEVDIAVDNMTMMIEPMLTIFLAVIVGGIMMAIMAPTFAAAAAAM